MIDTFFGRIRTLMTEGRIEPSPSNYEFLFRYLSGADPQLTHAVNAILQSGKPLTPSAIVMIRRQLYGNDRSGIGHLLHEAEQQLNRVTSCIEQSDADARTYRDRLDIKAIETAGTIDRQRAVMSEMVAATNTMISKTEELQQELARSSREIELLKAELEITRIDARSDALTGLANRKACCDYLDAQIARAHDKRTPLSAIFLDIDHFKRFNDNFGHRMGDEVLRLVAQNLEQSFHGHGFVSRWGGEEFVVVMPDISAIEAAGHAERFRARIATRTVRTRQSGREIGRITLSLGVADLRCNDTAQLLIDRSDRALYEAKAEGRDRVVTCRAAA
jgi:diguanylate cyclase